MPVLKFGTGAKASAVEMHVAVIHGHRVPPVGPFWPYRLVPSCTHGKREGGNWTLK